MVCVNSDYSKSKNFNLQGQLSQMNYMCFFITVACGIRNEHGFVFNLSILYNSSIISLERKPKICKISSSFVAQNL